MAIPQSDLKRIGPGSYQEYILRGRQRFEQGRAATVKQIRDVYLRAATSLRNDIQSLTPGTLTHGHFSALVKALENRAREINQRTLEAIEQGIWLSVDAGSQGPGAIAEHVLGGMFGVPEVRRMFAGINERAVLSILSRTRHDGLKLSDRVWKTGERLRNTLARVVEDGITRGLNSRQLARDLQMYVQPGVWTYHKADTRQRLGVPADVSYEAMRLARTEMNNAFHEGMIMANHGTPGYRGIYWRLSGSHPVRDVCDDMAETMEHGEKGFYPAGKEPPRAHPQCLCVILPAYEDPEQLAGRLNRWVNDPSSQPDLEAWYNTHARQFLKRPSRPPVPGPQPAGLQAALDKAEREIAARPDSEKAYVFDQAGNLILAKDGGPNYVAFDPQDVVMFTGRDAILTHNHPRGMSLSPGDVVQSIGHDVAEIRAVSNRYAYSMSRPSAGWPGIMHLSQVFDDEHDKVLRQMWKAVDSGRLTPLESDLQLLHRVWTRVARRLGMKYQRVSR